MKVTVFVNISSVVQILALLIPSTLCARKHLYKHSLKSPFIFDFSSQPELPHYYALGDVSVDSLSGGQKLSVLRIGSEDKLNGLIDSSAAVWSKRPIEESDIQSTISGLEIQADLGEIQQQLERKSKDIDPSIAEKGRSGGFFSSKRNSKQSTESDVQPLHGIGFWLSAKASLGDEFIKQLYETSNEVSVHEIKNLRLGSFFGAETTFDGIGIVLRRKDAQTLELAVLESDGSSRVVRHPSEIEKFRKCSIPLDLQHSAGLLFNYDWNTGELKIEWYIGKRTDPNVSMHHCFSKRSIHLLKKPYIGITSRGSMFDLNSMDVWAITTADDNSADKTEHQPDKVTSRGYVAEQSKITNNFPSDPYLQEIGQKIDQLLVMQKSMFNKFSQREPANDSPVRGPRAEDNMPVIERTISKKLEDFKNYISSMKPQSGSQATLSSIVRRLDSIYGRLDKLSGQRFGSANSGEYNRKSGNCETSKTVLIVLFAEAFIGLVSWVVYIKFFDRKQKSKKFI